MKKIFLVILPALLFVACKSEPVKTETRKYELTFVDGKTEIYTIKNVDVNACACFGHRWYKHQDCPFTLRYNNFWGIYAVSFNDGKDDAVMIKGVDELQHILFSLQLDSNLKI